MKLAVKLPLALALVTVLIGALSALGLRWTMSAITDRSVRADALSQLTVAVNAYSAGSLPEFASLDNTRLPEPLRELAKSGRRATYVQQSPPVAWAAIGTSDGRVLAVRTSWQDASATLASLDRSLVLLVGVLTGIAGLLALAVAATLSRRLRSAEVAARAIADGDLTRRVGEAVSGRDEVAELARTIDALAANMQERLDSEKRVTADIAHDLRTPLTGLITAASLLPDDRAAELVRQQANRLWALVEDLLEVARLDEADQRIDLQERSGRELAQAAIAASGIEGVQLEIIDDRAIETDPRRVERVVVNLLANAVAHGAAPVAMVVDGQRLQVRDRGKGFPPELLAEGPRRFRTGRTERGAGHGLGLMIATGQARALGAQLTFENDPDGEGARATLTLPVSNPNSVSQP